MPERKEFQKSVCVDLDGVLAYYTHWKEGKIGPPVEEGIKLCKMLKDAGYYVIIQTCRLHPGWGPKDFKDQYMKLVAWLTLWKVPYDHIDPFGKAIAHAYVDDRAVLFQRNTGNAKDVFKKVENIVTRLHEGFVEHYEGDIPRGESEPYEKSTRGEWEDDNSR